jgi:hypothetical protein
MVCENRLIHKVWLKQVKRVLFWLMKIFFSCSIGFEIPIKHLWTAKIIGNAALFFIAIIGKLLTGVFARPSIFHPNALVIAFAMAAWGEFAFILAKDSRDVGLFDDDTFASVALAVLVSVIVAPFCLRQTLVYRAKRAMKEIHEAEDSEEVGGPCYFIVQTKSHASWGGQDALFRAVFNTHCKIIDFRTYHVTHVGLDAPVIYELYLKDPTITIPTRETQSSNQDVDSKIDAAELDEGVDKVDKGLPLKETSVVPSEIHVAVTMPKSVYEHHGLSKALVATVQAREKELHDVFFKALLGDNRKVVVKRWQPHVPEKVNPEASPRAGSKAGPKGTEEPPIWKGETHEEHHVFIAAKALQKQTLVKIDERAERDSEEQYNSWKFPENVVSQVGSGQQRHHELDGYANHNAHDAFGGQYDSMMSEEAIPHTREPDAPGSPRSLRSLAEGEGEANEDENDGLTGYYASSRIRAPSPASRDMRWSRDASNRSVRSFSQKRA